MHDHSLLEYENINFEVCNDKTDACSTLVTELTMIWNNKINLTFRELNKQLNVGYPVSTRLLVAVIMISFLSQETNNLKGPKFE